MNHTDEFVRSECELLAFVPTPPSGHHMCVIAEGLGCPNWLARTSGYGHLLGAATSGRTVSFAGDFSSQNLDPRIGDNFPYDAAVNNVCSDASFTSRQSTSADWQYAVLGGYPSEGASRHGS